MNYINVCDCAIEKVYKKIAKINKKIAKQSKQIKAQQTEIDELQSSVAAINVVTTNQQLEINN